MATESKLMQTSKFLRNTIILFVVISILVLIMPTIKQTIENFIQDPEPKPPSTFNPYKQIDQIFGNLDNPIIEEPIYIDQSSNPLISVNEDFTPFPTHVYIYKIKKPKETFLTVQNAQRIAESFGFETTYQTGSNNTLIWSQKDKILEFNKINQAYTLKINSYEDLNINDLVDINSFLNLLSEKLNRLQIQPKDFNLQNPYIIENDSFGLQIRIKAHLPSSAHQTENQNARNYILENNIPTTSDIYCEDPFRASMQIQIQGNNTDIEKWAGFEYTPTLFDSDIGVYEIILAEEAYEKIQQNLAYLVYISTDPNQEKSTPGLYVNEFKIYSELTQLIYLILQEEEYTYPMYLFRGEAELNNQQKADFIIYSPALK